MSDFIENLKKVNEEFLPITKHHCSKMGEHFDELFSVFNKHFTGDQPLKCIVPVFFEIMDWNNWQLSDFSYLYYFGCVSNTGLNKAFSLQSSVSAILPGFTKTALDNLNKRWSGRRTVRITTKEGTQDCESQCQLEHNRIGSLDEFRICSTCLQNLKQEYGITDIKPISRSKKGSLVLNKFELHERKVKKQFKRDVNLKARNGFARAMAKPVMHHSLYISEEYDLYYFFSNTVIDIIKNGRTRKRDMGLGGMFVLVEKSSINDENQNSFIRLFERITDKLANRIIHQYRMEEVMRQARKAAISQVFARNGSHNIGSHVLAKMITKETAQNDFSWNDRNYKPIDLKDDGSREKSLTEVKDAKTAIANFNSYLRDRMDFLADLSTSTPLMEVSKSLMSDVMAGMDANRILMNYISGVSSFEYSLQMRDCRDCEKKSCTQPCEVVKADGSDIPVSMPNDVMGFHALYIIIENVIRNTAKHGGSNGKVDFTLEVRPCVEDNTLFEIWLYDTCEKKVALTEEEKEEYKKLTGIEGIGQQKKIDLIVARQNANINKPILDSETNGLRHGAWGIIEMKVAAAYLRKIPIETVDETKYQVSQAMPKQFYTEHDGQKVPNIIKAVNKEGALAYVFHLMKPKELLVIDEKGELYEKLNKANGKGGKKTELQQLKDQGIWVQEEVDERKVYPHPFMYVIPKNGFDEKKYLMDDNLYKGNLPTRIIVKGKKPFDHVNNPFVAWDQHDLLAKINSMGNISEIQPVIEACWKEWIMYKMKYRGISRICSNGVTSFNPIVSYANYFNEKVLGQDKCKREENNVFNFAIDHHGQEIFKAFNDNGNGNCKFEHYEAHPSAVEQFLKKAKNQKIANSQLIEGILTNMIIIDERIQAIYKEKFYPEKKKKNNANNNTNNNGGFDNNEKLKKAANIHVPDNAIIDLNKNSFNMDDECNLHKAIDKAIKASTLKIGMDLIVIHLGVVERILEGSSRKKDEPQVKRLIQTLTSKYTARVVITSGRGKPDNLPNEVPFMSYSALSHYAVETPFKAFLNQSVQAARIFNPKKTQ